MFYVQNWDSNPQYSAFQTLQQQLVSIKKSLQNYDASLGAKKDSYLLTEWSKIQKFAYIIRDNLTTLTTSPGDPDTVNFLTHGDVSQLPALENGLKLFDQLETIIHSKVGHIQSQYETEAQKVQDPQYREFLAKAKHLTADETNSYGSRCGSAALKVIDIYSKYINPAELSQIRELEKLERMQMSNVEVLSGFQEGIGELRNELVKNLRNGEHTLYFCFFDNSCFKEVGGWQHPYYEGHAFVIEKTAQDKFRLYQGYLNQYSLKSFVAHELQKHPEGLKDYEDLYPFLKNLQVFSSAKKWDHEVNEAYKSCFGVDHKTFLGESISDEFFKLHFASMTVHNEEFQVPKRAESVEKPLNAYRRELEMAKSVAIGTSVGGAVSGALYISYYVISSLIGFLA